MELNLIELNRCRDAESVSETTEPLDVAKILYRVGSTAVNFDLSKIGTGDDPEVIISVRREDYAAARAVLEEEYSKFDLPDGHYLLSSSDEELAEILAKSSEWNAFDVAHARRLAVERDIDSESIEKKKEERIQKLKEGKPASKKLLLTGWIFSFTTLLGWVGGLLWLSGLIGIGVAWSLCYMKEKTPDGDYYTYDFKTREFGKPMLFLSNVTMLVGVVIWLISIS